MPTSDQDLTKQAIFDLGVSLITTEWSDDRNAWVAIAKGRKRLVAPPDTFVTPVLCEGTGNTEDGALENLLTSVHVYKKANPDAYEETGGGSAEVVQQVEGDSEQEISTTGNQEGKADGRQATSG